MRKIDHDMVAAIRSRQSVNLGNTRVQLDGRGCGEVYLYDTRIARFSYQNGTIELNNGGYFTETTKRRLNSIISSFTRAGTIRTISSGEWVWKDGQKWDESGVMSRFLV
jgi:hypothetical protein